MSPQTKGVVNLGDIQALPRREFRTIDRGVWSNSAPDLSVGVRQVDISTPAGTPRQLWGDEATFTALGSMSYALCWL